MINHRYSHRKLCDAHDQQMSAILIMGNSQGKVALCVEPFVVGEDSFSSV